MDTDIYEELRAITDGYLRVLHQINGYYIDSLQGFKAYLDSFTASQVASSKKYKTPIHQIDKASLTYATGDPIDPNAIITHECTQGELKERLKPGGLNEILVGQFCTVMIYEHWEKIRGDLAITLQEQRQSITSEIFGDIRHIRHDIVHNAGIATKEHSEKAVILNWFKNGMHITINNQIMNIIMDEIFKYFNRRVLEHTGKKVYSDNSLSLEGKAKQMRYINAGGMKIL